MTNPRFAPVSASATSQGLTTYSSSAVAATLTAMPSQTRGSFIGGSSSGSGSGRHDPVDGDAAVLVRHLEALADHFVELGQASGRVVCPFEAAHDDQLHAVL